MITEQDRSAAESAASNAEQDDLETSRIRHHENLEAQSLATLSPPEPPPLTTRQRLIQACEAQLARWQTRLETVQALPPAFDTLTLPANYGEYYGTIDFDYLPHDKVIEVIKAVGGKWKKAPNGAKAIDYETTIGGTRIRCYMGEPPPQCKLVEVEVTIPAQPERKEKQWKMVCPEQEDATI